MYLVDTSAWIAFFRNRAAAGLFKPEEIGICLPIYQEVLQGIRHEADYRDIKGILDAAAFFDSPLPKERFEEAAHIFRSGRKMGKTIRSATDCLIAAIAVKYDLIVLHEDRDFPLIGEFTDLRQRRVPEL